MQTKIGVAQSIYVIAILAKQEGNTPVKSHIISNILCVSDSYLKKIIRKLVIAGLLNSSASKTGGLSLKKPPEEITLFDVYDAIEGDTPFFNCSSILETFAQFNDNYFSEKGKKTVEYFKEAEDNYKNTLKSHTIAEILDFDKEGIDTLDFNDITYMDFMSGRVKDKITTHIPPKHINAS